ncbi:MAG: hypothetical protein AB7V19_05215 [Candidatus Bipolaricaulia bacterium]
MRETTCYLLALALLTAAPVHPGPSNHARARPPVGAAKRPLPPSFARESFDTTLTALPPHFPGHSVAAVYRQLRDQLGKDEFESSDAFRRRVDALAAPLSVYAFWLENNHNTYDADRSLMMVHLSTSGYINQPVGETVPGTDSDERTSIKVLFDVLSEERYVGSNAFGATIAVTRSVVDDYEVLPVGSAFDPSLALAFPLAPDRARLLHDRLRVLLVCHLVRPDNGEPLVWEGFLSGKPTFDNPTELLCSVCYLNARVIGLWVCDKASGEIVYKYAPSAL